MKALYDAILTRELDRAGELVRKRCDDGEARDVLDDLLRFSVLAFAPSLHSRSTMEAALAIAELFDRLAEPRSALVELSRYAGESHVPWGKAPMTDPPKIPSGFRATEETIDAAVASGDIREAERWLAVVVENGDPLLFFDAARRFAGSEGYGFRTAASAWKIADRFPPFVRFAVLRMALLEWLQDPVVRAARSRRTFDELAGHEVLSYVRSGGGAERFQTLALIDAILVVEDAVGEHGRYRGLAGSDAGDESRVEEAAYPRTWSWDDLAYRYAIDFAMFLRSVPMAERLERVAEPATCEKIPAAARHFLNDTDGFETWSFA